MQPRHKWHFRKIETLVIHLDLNKRICISNCNVVTLKFPGDPINWIVRRSVQKPCTKSRIEPHLMVFQGMKKRSSQPCSLLGGPREKFFPLNYRREAAWRAPHAPEP